MKRWRPHRTGEGISLTPRPDSLEALIRAGVLDQEGERYELPEAVRRQLQRRLTGEQRKRLHLRLRRHPTERLCAAEGYGDSLEWSARFRCDSAHFQQAIDRWIDEPPTPAGLDFLRGVRFWWSDGRFHEGMATLARIAPYLVTATERLEARDAGIAAETLGQLAMERGEFDEAVRWFQTARARFGRVTRGILQDLLMARRRFDEALAHNDQAFALREGLGERPDALPVLWNQHASILAGMGRQDEAQRAWDKAIAGYSAQQNRGGVAECYQPLGAQAAGNGQVGLGRSLIQQAIAIFADTGNQGAMAAAKATLGDIHRQRGEMEMARALYQGGLAYWTAKGHPRWIEHFRERLERLDEPTPD